jgi:hypothetical protein
LTHSWSIFNIKRFHKLVFTFGLYYGSKKPVNYKHFLEGFINKIRSLIENGIVLHGRSVAVKIKGIICDAPAKSFILCTKDHKGHHVQRTNRRAVILTTE